MRRALSMCARVALIAGLVGFNVGDAQADPVSVGAAIRLSTGLGTGGYGGGEFYVDVESNGEGIDFVSFCLQRYEYFTPGATMYVGGISDHTEAGGNPLSAGTAFLYTQFRAGTLSGYNTTTTALHRASATALQLAIWVLQGQMDRSAALALSSQVAGFLTLGEGAVASGWGIGQVRVLNLFGNTSYTQHRQDQLTLVGVPEPGTLALLLVGGAMALAGKRRRFSLR